MTQRIDRRRRIISAIVHAVAARVDLDAGLYMGFEFFRGAVLSRDRHVVVVGARACPVEPDVFISIDLTAEELHNERALTMNAADRSSSSQGDGLR
eukprot:6015716-Pyramimonas_sp.AAC.1